MNTPRIFFRNTTYHIVDASLGPWMACQLRDKGILTPEEFDVECKGNVPRTIEGQVSGEDEKPIPDGLVFVLGREAQQPALGVKYAATRRRRDRMDRALKERE